VQQAIDVGHGVVGVSRVLAHLQTNTRRQRQ
jgi:hypothetical protein